MRYSYRDLILGHLWVNLSKIMIFCKNEEKIVGYCMHTRTHTGTLIQDVNLFRITAYMTLITDEMGCFLN